MTTLTAEPQTAEECGKCGRQFPSLAEVFSHECDGPSRFVHNVPNGFGGTTSLRRTDPRANGSNLEPVPSYRTNKFAAPCVSCGQRVEAEAGRLDRGNSGWEVRHVGACPAAAPQSTPAPTATTTTTTTRPAAARSNRFAGKCVVCGKRVEEQAGTLERVENKWQVAHRDGECPSSFPFPEGHYALEHEDAEADENRIRFYLCADGMVSHQVSSDYLPVRNRQEIIDLIAADPEAASARYGRELGCCGICSRTLTNDDSRKRGIGPVCASKAGW